MHFLNDKFAMEEEYFKEVMKDIQYVNGNPPVFQIPSYYIKADKSHVRTGDYIYFVSNEKYLVF